MSWIISALAVLGAGATVSLLICPRRGLALGTGLIAVTIACALCIAAACSVLSGAGTAEVATQWPLPLGTFVLSVDGLSAWFLLGTGAVGSAAAIYSWGYFGAGNGPGANRAYAPLLCVLVAGIVLVICAGDAVLFLAGWEMMSLSAFFLVGLNDEDPNARRGAWTYLIATHLGTGLGVFPLFGAFIARTGGTRMSEFAGAFASAETNLCVALFVLGVAGFGTKAGFVPFHVWLPIAHPVAPSPISALMSGVVIKTGIYGLIRLISWLPALPGRCGAGLMVLSVVTGIVGILYALGQRDLKRMLAYSSVENIGIVGLAIAVAMLGRTFDQPALVILGLGGALLHTLNHSLFKGLLFLSAGAVLHGAGTGDVERLGGLARVTPVNAAAFLTGAVAICALPPLNGFVGEYVIYTALLGGLRTLPSPNGLLVAASAAFLALIGGAALAAFTKMFSVVFLGAPRDPAIRFHPTPGWMNAGMLMLAGSCAAVVILTGLLAPAVAQAVAAAAPSALVRPEEILAALRITDFLALPLAIFLAAVCALWLMRRLLPAGAPAPHNGGTWGCGYAYPAPSMQYTGSSYGWALLSSFPQIARPKRRATAVQGYFPAGAACETEISDWALARIYQPLFRGIARRFEALAPLQHGRIHLYLVYIVVTVIAVFLVEAWRMPTEARADRDLAPDPVRDAQSAPEQATGLEP